MASIFTAMQSQKGDTVCFDETGYRQTTGDSKCKDGKGNGQFQTHIGDIGRA
ncbi:hypothetical protein D1872_348150 [compost metagenome]